MIEKIRMDLAERSYDIVLGEGALSHLCEYMNLSRKIVIVTDSGVPKEYAGFDAPAFGRS